jgi:hypothetical protein
MTPTIPVSPAAICCARSAATLGWLRWFLDELPCEQSTMIAAWASGFFCLIVASAFWTCSDLDTPRQ